MEQIKFSPVGIIEFYGTHIPAIYINQNEKLPPEECRGMHINSNSYFSSELKKMFVKITLDSDEYNIHKEFYIDADNNLEFFDLLSKVWCFAVAKEEQMYMIQIAKISNLNKIYENLRQFKETGVIPNEQTD